MKDNFIIHGDLHLNNILLKTDNERILDMKFTDFNNFIIGEKDEKNVDAKILTQFLNYALMDLDIPDKVS